MEIIKATSEFILKGMPYPGFPILVGNDMEIVKPVFQFLIYECVTRGRVQSLASWNAFGQAMYDYFGYLEARDIDWREFSYDGEHSIVAAYRDWSIKDMSLANSTVNYRLRLVIRFYHFSYNKGWISHLPFDIESVIINKPSGFFSHTDKSGGLRNTPDVLLKEVRPSLKILTRSQAKVLLLKTAANPTLDNIVRLGLQTGLRKEELLSFPLKYVSNPSRSTIHRSMIRIRLEPGDMKLKGNKPRSVDVPRTLMERLWDYSIHERHKRLVSPEESPKTLFVNYNGKAWSLKSRTLNNMLRELGLDFNVTPHMFRHTYATNTLHYMRLQKCKTDPLLYVRDRLGHTSVQTTIRYLHYLSEIEDDLMTKYQEEIDRI